MAKRPSAPSVLALWNLLSEVAANPAIHAETTGLKEALTRQGRLAKLDLPMRGVIPVALNTLKRNADRTLAEMGGFNGLNELRQVALAAIENHLASPQPASPYTRDALRAQLKQAKSRNRQLREDLAFVSERFRTMMSLAERCAMAADPLTQSIFKRQRAEILTSLGLRSISSPRDPIDNDDIEQSS